MATTQVLLLILFFLTMAKLLGIFPFSITFGPQGTSFCWPLPFDTSLLGSHSKVFLLGGIKVRDKFSFSSVRRNLTGFTRFSVLHWGARELRYRLPVRVVLFVRFEHI